MCVYETLLRLSVFIIVKIRPRNVLPPSLDPDGLDCLSFGFKEEEKMNLVLFIAALLVELPACLNPALETEN